MTKLKELQKENERLRRALVEALTFNESATRALDNSNARAIDEGHVRATARAINQAGARAIEEALGDE